MITLGKLTFEDPKDHLELLAAPVKVALMSIGAECAVAPIDPSLSDTANFCEHYGIPLQAAANCVILEGKIGEERQLAACVILANTRADVNKVVRDHLGVKKVSFAQMEKAVSESGMEFGAITPVGLPPLWPILVDKAVTLMPYVVIGSGIRGAKLAVPGSFFAHLPNVRIIEGLAHPKE